MDTIRINARLDPEAARQVEFLTATTGRSVSEVVREAIAVYHGQVRQNRVSASKFLALAGTGNSGRSDIASNYKVYVAEAIDAKFARMHGTPPRSARPKSK